ncbi:MAG: hypothetical protein HYU66_24170 [Armatimonadetes bacterium]|nr:hypothetical protein [Armatimonadota bacterium]
MRDGCLTAPPAAEQAVKTTVCPQLMLALATNLAGNPSFETGQGVPDGWERYQYPGTSLTRDVTVARGGSASAHATSDAEGAREYPCFRCNLTTVAVGEEYEGSAWARTRWTDGLGGDVTLEVMRAGKRLCFMQSEVTGAGDHDWMRLHVRAMVPDGADALVLALVAHGVGEVWFDDAELVRTREAPPAFTGDRVSLRVRPEHTLCARLDGLGAHGDFLLTRECNTQHGVDERDRELILRRVEAMRPHLVRTLFDYQWWEPAEGRQTPDSEALRDYVMWVRFLKRLGTAVLVHPWGDYFAYPAWMRDGTSRLPRPEKRDAMVRSLVDFVEFLRRDQGLDNVQYLSLMNEPDSDALRSVTLDEYLRLNHLLDRLLRERGLRRQIRLLGADECQSGPSELSPWYAGCAARGLPLWDSMSVHTYRHQYVPNLEPWLAQRQGLLRGSGKPLLVTEFGYGGETFRNWENDKYEYGLFLADFAVTALRGGASAALMWCLGDTYYTTDLRQEYGLWHFKDQGWEPRPGFYAWSLLTRYTRRGSRVVAVESPAEAPDVRAVALVSARGELTVLVVNRYPQAVQVTLRLGLARPAALRVYRYSREGVPTADRGMIAASGELGFDKGAEVRFELPAEALAVATEVR